MVSALFGFLSAMVGWLLTHLPASPFASLTLTGVDGFGSYSFAQILGWVNWLIPFQDCLTLFSLWLGALCTASVVLWVARKAVSIGTGSSWTYVDTSWEGWH